MPVVDNPILLDLPNEFETERLLVRVPRQGDGAAIYEAVTASYAEFAPWLSWPERATTPERAEAEMREAAGNFMLRKYLVFLLFSKGSGRLVGGLTVHHLDWHVPSGELGYWLRTSETGKGYMVEAARAMTDYCFRYLFMERIEIWCDTRNQASARVARRVGYTLEARTKNSWRDKAGHLVEEECYVMLRPSV